MADENPQRIRNRIAQAIRAMWDLHMSIHLSSKSRREMIMAVDRAGHLGDVAATFMYLHLLLMNLAVHLSGPVAIIGPLAGLLIQIAIMAYTSIRFNTTLKHMSKTLKSVQEGLDTHREFLARYAQDGNQDGQGDDEDNQPDN